MGDFRISSIDFVDSHSDRARDGSKKRSKRTHVEPQEELTDQVALSSAGDTEEQEPGYLPASSDEEPK
jgi:hypothetical protein